MGHAVEAGLNAFAPNPLNPDRGGPGPCAHPFDSEQRVGCFLFAQGVDGDQGDNEFGHRAADAIDQAAELDRWDRDGQAPDRGQGDPASGIPEDDPFLFEGPEQAVQGR